MRTARELMQAAKLYGRDMRKKELHKAKVLRRLLTLRSRCLTQSQREQVQTTINDLMRVDLNTADIWRWAD